MRINSRRLEQTAATLILISIFLMFLNAVVLGQEVKKVGTSAATFLRIPVGARGTSMGGAFVATANDASAMFWNPGGAPRVEGYSLMVDYSDWLPGLHFSYFGWLFPVSTLGTFGVNVTALGTDEMDVTTPDQPMGTGEKFTATSMAVGITYGRNLTDRFSLGATFKYINERILNSNAIGFAVDIGAIYDTPFSGIRLGFSIANAGTKMQMRGEDLNIRVDIDPSQLGNNQSVVGQLKTDPFALPLIMRLGLSWDAFNTENQRLTIAADGLNPNDNGQSLNVGAEYALFKEMLLLRGGYNELFLDKREMGLAIGVGVKAKLQGGLGFSADYAFQNLEHLGDVNRFTFGIVF